MFSKELQELDRNTVQYMIDEMQDTINDQKNTIAEQENTIAEQENVQLAYARELLKSSTDFSVIAQSTGLSIDVIKKL